MEVGGDLDRTADHGRLACRHLCAGRLPSDLWAERVMVVHSGRVTGSAAQEPGMRIDLVEDDRRLLPPPRGRCTPSLARRIYRSVPLVVTEEAASGTGRGHRTDRDCLVGDGVAGARRDHSACRGRSCPQARSPSGCGHRDTAGAGSCPPSSSRGVSMCYRLFIVKSAAGICGRQRGGGMLVRWTAKT